MLRCNFEWQFQSRAASFILFGAILLFISFIFIALSAKDVYRARRIAAQETSATGTIIEKNLHRASDDGTSNTSYDVSYVFTTVDGRQIQSNDTVDADIWDQLPERGPVAVQYAATAPTINRLRANTGTVASAYLVLMIGAAVGLMGVPLVVLGLRTPRLEVIARSGPLFKARASPWIVLGCILSFCGLIFLLVGLLALRQDRLFRADGVIAPALVLTKSSHVEINGQNNVQESKYEVGYRFATPDGGWVRGSDKVDGRTWRSIRERDLIQIVYLPEHPARNRLVATDPGTGPWVVIMLGGSLTTGGVVSLGCGFLGATRKRRLRRR